MNRTGLLLALMGAALLSSCDGVPTNPQQGPNFAAGGEGPSASGHIERDFGTVLEKYSFNANYLGSGQVHGRFNVRDFFADGSDKAWAKGIVTCFTLEADGRTARMGGIVESADLPEFVGTDAAWTVQDNGEGDDAEDLGTDLRWGLPPGTAEEHCTVGFPPEAFGTYGPTARGNVQVRPE